MKGAATEREGWRGSGGVEGAGGGWVVVVGGGTADMAVFVGGKGLSLFFSGSTLHPPPTPSPKTLRLFPSH